MRKLVLHLAIACATFAFSTSLTNIWRSLTSADVPSQTVQLSDSYSHLTVPSDEFELLRIFGQYGDAQTSHDQGFFERVETDDFILFAADGQTLTRTEDINAMNNSPSDIVYKLEVQKVELLGNMALVTSTMTSTEGDYTVTWPSIDICVKRAGRWQIRSSTEADENGIK